MKKMISIALFVALIFALSACGQKYEEKTKADNAEKQEGTGLAGSWSRPASPAITDEVKTLLDKAVEAMTGATYLPVAYLGSQVVAGTNHAVLCRTSPDVQNAIGNYVIVYLYADLDGNAKITEIIDSDRSTDLNNLAGGWFQTESPEMTKEARDALDKATEGVTGASYTPLALLSTQVVAGMNYCILCEIMPVVPKAESHYSLVYVFADLNGNAEITETVDFAA